MFKTIEQLKAVLPITNFDWHMQGQYFVIFAGKQNLRQLKALKRLISDCLKPMLWECLDGSRAHTIRIFVG